jgi:ribosomal protein L11 methyltransferase
VRAAAARAGLAAEPHYSTELLQDRDWVRLTQSQFDPIRISARLWIVPSWHEFPDPDAINLELDPGLAFGTGSHPTTRLCLQWLDSNVRGGESILDYGCGSGILAIAAKKLGAGQVVGIDIDPQAVQAAAQNAERNHVAARFYLPDAAPEAQYDVVVANILSNPLKVLAPALSALVRRGGRIALSGVLAEQAEDVGGVYSEWFDMNPPVFDEGWACVTGIKR